MSDSLRPHGLQHTRPSCPPSTPTVYSNSCPLSQWCHPTILSSVIPFTSRLQSFPVSGPFPVSQFFASSGQNIGVSTSASVLPVNIQNWFPLGWLVRSPCSPRDSQEFSPAPQFRSINVWCSVSLMSDSHVRTWPLGPCNLYEHGRPCMFCFAFFFPKEARESRSLRWLWAHVF